MVRDSGLPELDEPTARNADAEAEQAAIDAARHREAIHEGLQTAIPSMIRWTLLAGVLLALLILALKQSFIGADLNWEAADDMWYYSLMPALLISVLGGAFGALSGWRMTLASGLVGRPAWIVGSVGVLALTAIGLVAGFFIFSEGVPMMFLLGLVTMAIAGLVASTAFTLWGVA